METKAKDLKVGDIIYLLTDNLKELFEKDYYSSPPRDVIKKVIKRIEIFSIEKGEKGKNCINRSKSSSGDYVFQLEIQADEMNETIIKREKDYTYFFNEYDCNQVIRDGVVKYINKLEQSIKDFEIKQLKSCEELRKHFWDFLQ